jgi:hypothetical protein
VLVPALAEPTDRGGEVLDAGEVAAAKRLAVDDEEDFDQVEPGRRGRGETQFDAWCLSASRARPGACGWRSCRRSRAGDGRGRPGRPA